MYGHTSISKRTERGPALGQVGVSGPEVRQTISRAMPIFSGLDQERHWLAEVLFQLTTLVEP